MATPPRAKHRGKRASGPSQHLNPGTVRPHNPWTTVRSGSDGATGGRAAITVALGAVVLAVAMLRYSMAPVRGPQQLADECDATMQALTAILDPLVDPDAAWAGATPLMRLDLEGSAAGQCLRRLVALGPDDVNGGAAPLHRVVAACAPSVDVAVTERCVDASSADIVDILETLAASMSRAADVLHVSIIVPRLAALSSAPQVQNSSLRALDVVVVGAGPVGLATALTAHAHGASVTVVEKRDDYTRDVWFDLTDLEVDGSASVETLRRWALHEFAPRVDDHRSEGVSGIVSIRCRELERFLSQVASAVGVDVIRGQELVQWSHACTSSVAAAHSLCRHAVHTARADGTRASSAGADASLHLPFDVAFVCDGAQSEGRRMLDAHVAFVGQHSLQPVDPALTDSQLEGAEHGNGQGGVITVPGLRQATLVAKLAPLPSGDCPALKRDTSGAAVDPFYPSFVIDGVTSVFKRFFSPYCEIQVLFSHVAAQRIRDRAAERAASSGATRADGTGERVTSDSDAFPWETLLAVARLVLDEPPAGLEQLRTMLLTTPDNGQPDVRAAFVSTAARVWCMC